MVIETWSPKETYALGEKIGREALPGQVYTLNGDLGVGKTVFTQGVAAGLGIQEPVNSPTFTIVQVYEEGRMPFYHFDVYRIGDVEEMEEIGYQDYFYGEGLCMIEWAQLIEEIIPENARHITIEKDLDKGFDYRRITIESSGLVASVAVMEDDNLIAEYTMNHKKTHSQTLVPMMDEVRSMVELDLSTIDAIAVAAGPGAFTGLRIGSATAKGLGLALNKPIIPVPTVDALAFNLYASGSVICPLMDARRNQVYTGLYEFVKNATDFDMHCILEQCTADIAEIVDKVNALGKDVIFLGDGVAVYKTAIPTAMHRQAVTGREQLAWQPLDRDCIRRESCRQPQNIHRSICAFHRLRENARRLQMVIREMQAQDVEAVTALEAACFTQPWKRHDFEDILTNPDRFYFVAVEDNEVMGGCMLTDIVGEGDVSNVAVHEKYRRRGIAHALLEYMLQFGRKRGIRDFTLEVRQQNVAAQGLYEGLGFVSEGVRPNFYDKPKDNAVIMWLRQAERI